MNDKIRDLLGQIAALDEQLKATLLEQESRIAFRIRGKRVELDTIWRRQKSRHGFCRLGAGSRAGAARRSEPLTRRRGDTLIYGCERGIFALTAMLIGAFSSPTFVGFASPVTKEVQSAIRGAHGVLVTAVSRSAFSQALGMLHKRGTMSLVGLPPGDFALPIFDVVLNAKTVRGSIAGTRKDLQEALEFAAEGKVHTVYSEDSLDNINAVFGRLRSGVIDGRIVMRIAEGV